MSAAQREKGKRGELEVAAIFRNAGFDEPHFRAERNIEECRRSSFDVRLFDARKARLFPGIGEEKLLPFAIQVKNTARNWGFYMLNAFREAARNVGYEPIGVVKIPTKPGNIKRDQWVAVVRLEHYAELLRRAQDDGR